jgi:predicted dehydrogenase
MANGDFSRRQVLGMGAGAASSVLLGTGALRAAQEDKTDIRCGIIGVGGRGGGVLMAIHKAPGVRVTAVCDIDKRKAQQAFGRVEEDQPKLFSDYREMIGYPELDAIFVETPCYLHAEMVLAVLESGRHCYGEKPMALTVRDLNRIAEAAKRSKGIYQVGTQLRYASPWQPAIEVVRSGEVGKPIMIRSHRHNAGDMPHDREWYFNRELSGDTICEQAVHEFDLFNWILDGVPEKASGFGEQSLKFEPEGRNILDNYGLVLDYGKDKTISYSHSWISVPKIPYDGRQILVYCSEGAVDIENGMIYPRDGGDPKKVSEEPKGDSTQLAVNDFFRCIREGDKPLADAEAGRNGVLVALLGRKAIDEERVVTMKELLAEGA